MRGAPAASLLVTVIALGGYIGACGGPGGNGFGTFDAGRDAYVKIDARKGHDALPVPESGKLPSEGGPSDATVHAVVGTLTSIQVLPADDVVTVQGGKQASIQYKVMAVVDSTPPAVDVTSRFVFYVPDNYLVGGFPLDGSPTFATRLPTSPTDPPQMGGKLTIQAEGLNPGPSADAGPVTVFVTTSLTVQLTGQFTGPVTPADMPDGGAVADAGAVPSNAATLFGGPARTSYAPTIAYPNDGVMLPPNLKVLEVQWVPQPGTTLYEVSFYSAAASLSYFVRCGTVPSGALAANACALVLDSTGYGYLAQSNAGGGPVTVTVQATDDQGTGVGTSTPITIQFAEQSVNGGVYYWNATQNEIMRFDFGGTGLEPEVFLAPGWYGLPAPSGSNTECVGCHAISPDGTKMAASLDGEGNGQLVYLNNLAASPGDAGINNTSYLTIEDDGTDHIQFASFNPSGSEFVAVYGDGTTTDPSPTTPGYDAGAPSYYNLWLHDGNTGRITSAVTLGFEPDHPNWSPDGTMIAVTHVGVHHTSQCELAGGIDVIPVQSGVDGGTLGLGAPVTLVESMQLSGPGDAGTGYNRYSPSFAPDSSFLYYTETSGCTTGPQGNWWYTEQCDSDSHLNVNATTWAIVPKAGATPVHLDRAGSAGYADHGAVPLDTFPRSTPFVSKQGTGKLFWFTVASERQAGMRTKALDSDGMQELMWMFAVDPDKILAGQDGSYPGFFLPFQDMTTSNHIAEWTKSIVSATPPPPPPTPPPPPPPPPPPSWPPK